MSNNFHWETDSEDYIDFRHATGDLSVEEDGSSARTIRLTRESAEDLGIKLIDWAKR